MKCYSFLILCLRKWPVTISLGFFGASMVLYCKEDWKCGAAVIKLRWRAGAVARSRPAKGVVNARANPALSGSRGQREVFVSRVWHSPLHSPGNNCQERNEYFQKNN